MSASLTMFPCLTAVLIQSPLDGSVQLHQGAAVTLGLHEAVRVENLREWRIEPVHQHQHCCH